MRICKERDIEAEKQRDKDKYTDTEAWIHGPWRHRQTQRTRDRASRDRKRHIDRDKEILTFRPRY